jgi:cytochrome oxidase Cu insertion factor (SCO1/SenC/PrrC family)
MFIKCKRLEHVAEKDTVDPRTHMVHLVQQWNKIGKELQKFIHMKVPTNETMCKDFRVNFDYKKLVNYHKGTKHHASFWLLTMEECDIGIT